MILIIDNYDSFTYNLYQLVAVCYEKVKVVRNDELTLAEINDLPLKGIILSPGPGRPEQAGICIDIIRAITLGKIHAALLGVCLGHQAIVSALGGNIIQANEIVHGKKDEIFHDESYLYQSLPLPFIAGRYHSLIADRTTLPEQLIIEAENKQKLIMGVRHKTLPIYGVQFHPESILTREGKRIIESFVGICHDTKTKH